MTAGLGNWLSFGLGMIGLVFLGLWGLARLAAAAPELDPVDGRLPPCPASPNCVSSQADPNDKVHYLAPIGFADDPEAAWRRLQAVVSAQPRVTLRRNEAGYLHAEFRSRVFGFVDDVQFILDPQNRLIHFRSASRTGYSDLGVNRKRIEAIRKAFGEAMP